MVVGCLQITLVIHEAESLKDKRSVVRRCVDRVRHRFNVSVAEVADNDNLGRAVIGVTAVANEAPFVNSVLDKVIDAVESDVAGRADVVDTKLEILHV